MREKKEALIYARFPPDDKNLPSVPPLQLSVPADYPDQSPHWADGDQYGKAMAPLTPPLNRHTHTQLQTALMACHSFQAGGEGA